jgi:DNA gyrase/topoisomerase IV subunit B
VIATTRALRVAVLAAETAGMTNHASDAAELRSALMAVRMRPDMYFGTQRTDPGLPGAVLWLAVGDALSEEPISPPLHVRVVIQTGWQFTVEDNGPGLPVEPVGEGREPAVTEMLSGLFCGHGLPRGWQHLAAVTAMCSMVTADVWRQGRHYRQRANWSGAQGPLEALEPAQRHGTRLVVRLDDDYLAAGAGLPIDPAGFLVELLDGAGPFSVEPGPAPGARLQVIDDRTGARVLRVKDRDGQGC